MGEPARLGSAVPFQPGAVVGHGRLQAYSRLPQKDLLGDCFLRLLAFLIVLIRKPFTIAEKSLLSVQRSPHYLA